VRPDAAAWRSYLGAFHHDAAGVTEEILARSRDAAGHDPYERVAAVVAGLGTRARILDLACGSAPLVERLEGVDYLGIDRSPEELALARRRAPGARFVEGDALDVVSACRFDVVICSMSLQVLDPLADVLAGVAAVLRPGGLLVATVPSSGALSATDKVRWLAVVSALRFRLRYPNDALVTRLPDLLATAGLDLVSDEQVRYTLPLRDRADAERLIASLYLPGVPRARRRAAATVLHRTGSEIGLSLRHVVAARRR